MNFDWFHLAVWWTSVCYKSSPEICRASTPIHPYRSALPFLLLSICLNPHENICEASLQNTAPERREGAAEESRGKEGRRRGEGGAGGICEERDRVGERTAEATTGVSTIVLKTPGWNSKDVAESLSPSLSPSRRGAYLFRNEARSGTHERAALPPPSKSSDVARRAHDVIVVAETKLSLHRALPLPLPRQLYVGVLLERS